MSAEYNLDQADVMDAIRALQRGKSNHAVALASVASWLGMDWQRCKSILQELEQLGRVEQVQGGNKWQEKFNAQEVAQ